MTAIDVENQKVDALFGEERPPIAMVVTGPQDLAALRTQWQETVAIPVLYEGRGEGIDNSWASLDIRTLLRGEQSAGRFAAHSVVIPAGAQLPAHYLNDAHTFLLVTEGALNMRVGAAVDDVAQHGFGYAPPFTHVGVRNTSDSPATVMVVHSPAGSDRAFAHSHEQWQQTGSTDPADYHDTLRRYGFEFDDAALDNDARTNQAAEPINFEIGSSGDLGRLRERFTSRPGIPQLIHTTPDEWDTSATRETRRVKQLLNGDSSAGTAMLNLISALRGYKAPAHHQPTEEEFFFVTGGTLQLTCATVTKAVHAGAFGFSPRNSTHEFSNESDTPVQLVTLNSPAGHERALKAFFKALASGADKTRLLETARAGGWIVHDPDALA